MDRTKLSLSSRRGSAIVEFALVGFTLLLVVFGMFEFCRMALVYADLASASRIAVRYAITHGVDRTAYCGSGSGSCGSSDGSATASSICGSSGVLTNFATGPLNSSNLVCTYGGTGGLGGGVGSTVQITVSYAYDPWFTVLPLSVTLSSTSQGVITY
jgi:Flp pilus assembly protein TadG